MSSQFSQLSCRNFKTAEDRRRRDAAAALSVDSSGLNLCAWQVQEVGKATNRCPSLQRLHVKGKGILQPSVSMGTLIRCETPPLPLLCHHSPPRCEPAFLLPFEMWEKEKNRKRERNVTTQGSLQLLMPEGTIASPHSTYSTMKGK